jgi:hypothetical protein
MQSVLFDDKGDTWDAKSRGLAEELGASLSPGELAKYVVRNLGFVAAAENEGSVSVRVRPAVVSSMALAAFIYWLHDRTVARVLISFLDREWSHELVASREEAVNKLLDRSRFIPRDREGDFLKKPKRLHELPDTSPLRAVLAAWADSDRKFDRERLQPVIKRAVNDRFVLVEASEGSPSLRIKDVGAGFGTAANSWLPRSIGLRVEDQPDYAYGKWVTMPYRQVLRTGEPSLDDVDAVITWPQHPRISYRYRRLVVPFGGTRDSTLLLSVTMVDPDINLRVKPA